MGFPDTFKIGFVILVVGIIIAITPFKDEMTSTDYEVQVSDWNVSWYYVPVEPTEEGFTGTFIGNSTFPPVFRGDWGVEGIFEEWIYSTVGFIARTDMEMPIDGYIKFEVLSGDGARLYVDGELVIDIWETRWDLQEVGSGSATVKISAGKHRLELWWYQWRGWAIVEFTMDRKVMVFEKKSEPVIGLGVACLGAVLMAIAKLKAHKPSKT